MANMCFLVHYLSRQNISFKVITSAADPQTFYTRSTRRKSEADKQEYDERLAMSYSLLEGVNAKGNEAW